MDKKNLTSQMAEYAVSEHFDTYTEKDLQMAKLSVADWVAAAYTGVTDPGVQKVLALAEEEHIAGDAVLIGQGKTSAPVNAALINGMESHAIDFDDIHDYLSLHLCSPVLPAALAAAQMAGSDGRSFLDGTMIGYQIMVALSAGMMPEHYKIARWHATGTIGIFGAAAAAGRILGLTPDQMCQAFGICAGLGSGIQLNFGTMAKPMAAGMAAKNGLLAVILAKRGFTGRADIFDTDYLKNVSGKEVDPEVIRTRLAGPQGVHELRFKRYPCGAPTHSGIINCRRILEEHPHTIEEIEKIVFEPYPRAIRLVGNMDPKTGLQGKFSIGFTAAAQIVFGQVTIETFTDENVMDSRVQYLLPRMELVGNDEFTYSRGGRTTMYFTDGTHDSHTTYLLGHEVDPEDAAGDVWEKYDEIMISRAGADKAGQIRRQLERLEESGNLAELCRLL